MTASTHWILSVPQRVKVFVELHSQKTVCFLGKIMFTDNILMASIFSCWIDAIVYTLFCTHYMHYSDNNYLL